MPIDLSAALGAEMPAVEFSWTSSDVQLYHLALGAGADPMDSRELSYLTDETPQVLPTFATVAPTFHATEPPKVSFPGVDIELAKVLHGTEQVTMAGPLPPSGAARSITRVVEIWDKGKAAVIVTESAATSLEGQPLWSTRRSIFARGEGGFGGERGPSASLEPPERPCDHEIDVPTLPQQALLYRLCGDRNPLHSDPEFAAAARFPRPILHGLCTYGITCKALVDTVLDSDAGRVKSFGARFAGVVFPGEPLRIRIWEEADRLVATVTAPSRADAGVLSGVELVPV